MTDSKLFMYANEPIINMRSTSDNKSEVISQTFFSEKIEVKQIQKDFANIKTTDGYEGWVPLNTLAKRSEYYPTTSNTKIAYSSRLKAHLYEVKDTIYGPLLTIPYGCKLEILEASDPRWVKIALPNYKECFIQKGDISKTEKVITSKDELIQLSKQFIGLPYTWGGRSSFGFDCSGFIQMLYKKTGSDLPRDSKDQVKDKKFENVEIKSLNPCDLIFFGKSDNIITHVGMYISADSFIHATIGENKPYIRISKLSDDYWNGNKNSPYTYRIGRKLINNLV